MDDKRFLRPGSLSFGVHFTNSSRDLPSQSNGRRQKEYEKIVKLTRMSHEGETLIKGRSSIE